MFRNIFICSLVLLSYAAFGFAAVKNTQVRPIDCAPQLKNSLTAIQKLPDANKLIAAIQQEGPIRILTNNTQLSQQFGAFWDADNRIIFVNFTPHASQGEIIGSILFELHNAAINSKLDHLDALASSGKIKKEDYVRAVEYLEYQNSLKASKIAQEGIDLGIFPASAHLPTYSNFEEHFRYQKIGGHSSWIAHTFDQLSRERKMM